jgi:hypothetical protein
MGKTANNERIKLKATYNNNISVGLYVGGFLIPCLAIMQKNQQMADFLLAAVHDHKIVISYDDLTYIATAVAALCFALFLADNRRKRADELIQKLSD